MFIIIRKMHILIFALILSIIGLTIGFYNSSAEKTVPVLSNVVVVDAGHGGMDGGSSGESGALEKDLNLKVAFFLKDMLEQNGKQVILTRDTDTSLHTTDSAKIRNQKRSDLEFRKKILDEHKDAVYVSIHMNKFEQPQYRGAQVFYAKNDASRVLGENIQKSLKDGLADGNTRVAKPAPSDVFILKNVSSVAAIVECGFLSNPDEEKLLSSEEYQKKIAQCICNALL